MKNRHVLATILKVAVLVLAGCTQQERANLAQARNAALSASSLPASPGVSPAVIDVTKAPYHLIPNSPEDQTDPIIRAIADGVARSATIYFPKGVYRVSRTIATVGPKRTLVLKGDSRSTTTIKLVATLGDRGLIEAVGQPAAGAPEKRNHARIEVSDITFDAQASDYASPGLSADAFRLSDVVLAKFESVLIKHFDGAAIRGYGWWDSVLNDVHFIRSGSARKNVAAVHLGSRDGDQLSGASNNIHFTNCRWEANYYVSLRLLEGARKINVTASKFHGILPEPAPYDHVQMYSSNSNVFSGNNFTHGGGSALFIRRSFGNVISDNTIGGQERYAIDMANSPRNVIMGNALNVELSGAGLGDVLWTNNEESQYLGNVGRRQCRLVAGNLTCAGIGPSTNRLID